MLDSSCSTAGALKSMTELTSGDLGKIDAVIGPGCSCGCEPTGYHVWASAYRCASKGAWRCLQTCVWTYYRLAHRYMRMQACVQVRDQRAESRADQLRMLKPCSLQHKNLSNGVPCARNLNSIVRKTFNARLCLDYRSSLGRFHLLLAKHCH